MKKIKILMIGLTLSLAIAAISITAFAASSYSSPAEIVAGLTGKTTDNIIAEKMEGQKTYGAIAHEAGKFTEFKEEILKLKKDNLTTRLEAGEITQERHDAILKALEENKDYCDDSGSAKIGQEMGARFGSKGSGQAFGGGQGQGQGKNGAMGGKGWRNCLPHEPAN
ncbi:MAG: hypothetical protein GX079_05740 [Tissierellia bacterium]|nr:hypothetical protein [Synergistaceae bacterium]NLY73175.1 hypothetical protein [Tissierellia bacterium]